MKEIYEKVKERPEIRVKIKGDAGIYPVWGIDWLNHLMTVERACGYESVSFDKIKVIEQPIAPLSRESDAGQREESNIAKTETDTGKLVDMPELKCICNHTQSNWRDCKIHNLKSEPKSDTKDLIIAKQEELINYYTDLCDGIIRRYALRPTHPKANKIKSELQELKDK